MSLYYLTGGGQDDSAVLPALPVLKDYDEDGDVDIDDLHILQQLERS